MKETSVLSDHHAKDLRQTLRNREALEKNTNLLYWYEQLYRNQFGALAQPERLRILEIGSGASPLHRFFPNVITSDVLELEYLDHIFDCHHIDQLTAIEDHSLDVITLTNVLHHLERPIDFLKRSALKLKQGAKLIAAEPYFSTSSTLIYKYLHHESVDFSISDPKLAEIHSPLESANIALPWLIFIKNPAWAEPLREHFSFDSRSFTPFSFVSYMATGGISHRIPIPNPIYRACFWIDMMMSRAFPKMLASFFIITLTRK